MTRGGAVGSRSAREREQQHKERCTDRECADQRGPFALACDWPRSAGFGGTNAPAAMNAAPTAPRAAPICVSCVDVATITSLGRLAA